MTSRAIQRVFPHVCAGPRCAVCWWVDVRPVQQAEARRVLLERLARLTNSSVQKDAP